MRSESRYQYSNDQQEADEKSPAQWRPGYGENDLQAWRNLAEFLWIPRRQGARGH
jgi:hypothetical protein